MSHDEAWLTRTYNLYIHAANASVSRYLLSLVDTAFTRLRLMAYGCF